MWFIAFALRRFACKLGCHAASELLSDVPIQHSWFGAKWIRLMRGELTGVGTGFPSARPYFPIHRDRTMFCPASPKGTHCRMKHGASIVSIMSAFLTSSVSSDCSSVHNVPADQQCLFPSTKVMDVASGSMHIWVSLLIMACLLPHVRHEWACCSPLTVGHGPSVFTEQVFGRFI